MRLLFVLPVAALVLSAADQATPPRPAGIPATAVAAGPYSYRYVDPKGQAWIYSQTPFGIARVKEQPASTAAAEPKADQIRATEAGDVIRFERPSPFGVSRWERRKSELNDAERAAWERSRTETRQDQR